MLTDYAHSHTTTIQFTCLQNSVGYAPVPFLSQFILAGNTSVALSHVGWHINYR